MKKVWQTDRRTDGQTENTICRAAWSQLKSIKLMCASFIKHWYEEGMQPLYQHLANDVAKINAKIYKSSVISWKEIYL